MLLLGGCSSNDELFSGETGGSSSAGGKVCAAGQAIQCFCAGGAQGAQVCKADGSGFDKCMCGASASSGGGATMASSSSTTASGSGGATGSSSSTSASSGTGGQGGGTGVVQLALAQNHSCARKSDGTVLCWGWNGDGQLGAASAENCPNYGACSTKPLAVGGISSTAQPSVPSTDAR